MKKTLLTIALGLSLAPAAFAQTVLQLGAAQTSAGSLPIVVAQQQGLFEEVGLVIERTDFRGGGPAIQALAGGSIEVCICAGDHALRLEEQGLGGKVIVALGDHHLYALMALSGSDAADLESLKGSKIGVTSAGGLADNTLRWAIKQAGLDPEADFEIIAIGRGGAMRAAVENGAIDAGTFTTPDIQANQALGDVYKIVYDFRSLPYAAQGLVALDSWLTANPDKARAVAGATYKALIMIQEDQSVLESAVKEMFPTFDDALVKQVASDVRADFLSDDGIVDPQAFTNMVETVSIPDSATRAVPYEAVMISDYLPAPVN
ncbi:ABC transporter substrate-binding protein [Puniceibacterium antarcticum]|nr:ABC transporter substrate-binding protein [Puniceibacterium antarcticum]